MIYFSIILDPRTENSSLRSAPSIAASCFRSWFLPVPSRFSWSSSPSRHVCPFHPLEPTGMLKSDAAGFYAMKGNHEKGRNALRKINGNVPGYDIEQQCGSTKLTGESLCSLIR